MGEQIKQVQKTCEMCGKVFVAHPNARFCLDCKHERERENKKNWKYKKKSKMPEKPDGISAGEICVLAKKEGMTYGQYVAKYGV